MLLANFKNGFSNFLAGRLQRWADFLRQDNQAANLPKANPPATPENNSPHEGWLEKTSCKPPQDWLERVSREAPQLLTEMPEFTVQTTSASENDALTESATNEPNEFQTDRRKSDSPVKDEAAHRLQSKRTAESTQSLPNPASKTKSKQRFSPLKIFAPRENSNRQNKVITNVSANSNTATDLAPKHKVQTDSTTAHSKSLPPNLRQTSIIKFERRSDEAIGESDSTNFKIGRISDNDSRRQCEQIGDRQAIKFRSKITSDISQERVLRRAEKNQENELDAAISSNKAVKKAIRTRLDNFVMPTENLSDNKKTSESTLLTRRNPPIGENLLPPNREKIAASNLPAALFRSQANQWADLPPITESVNEDELFEREKRRLRRIEAEQMGGGWNE